ncbi:6349_t:CDS:2 [Entrophospora sp. SA101]|nr:6349_t:CDS:2 [Entrophospora sp. SA101]
MSELNDCTVSESFEGFEGECRTKSSSPIDQECTALQEPRVHNQTTKSCSASAKVRVGTNQEFITNRPRVYGLTIL